MENRESAEAGTERRPKSETAFSLLEAASIWVFWAASLFDPSVRRSVNVGTEPTYLTGLRLQARTRRID